MNSLPFSEFDRIYQDCVRQVFAHWTPAMQARIAENCRSWEPGAFDFENYLYASSPRFFRAYRALAAANARRVCDVGGFWGVLAIALQRTGFDVTMTESLRFYGDAFAGLFDEIRGNGIGVVDYDPFEPGASLPETFDGVTIMAVVEHYPHSLRIFLENIARLVTPEGMVYIETPNIAYWPKRIAFLRGKTPLADARDIFRSGIPFVGHHHEYTMEELVGVAEGAGLRVVVRDFYNYSLGSANWKRMVLRPVETLAFAMAPSTRECLAITCRRMAGST